MPPPPPYAAKHIRVLGSSNNNRPSTSPRCGLLSQKTKGEENCDPMEFFNQLASHLKELNITDTDKPLYPLKSKTLIYLAMAAAFRWCKQTIWGIRNVLDNNSVSSQTEVMYIFRQSICDNINGTPLLNKY